ncbi:MAG: type II secretion system F family protein [Candidatus Nanohaloarchaeota archaeon QJJ-9]|nr:type II secretion system F family protein [Candidatus Nanohaloarchaeota archaeon QJJ-9]
MGLRKILSRKNSKDEKDKSDSSRTPKGLKSLLKPKFMPLAYRIKPIFPNLKKELIQAGMEEREATEYISESLVNGLQIALMVSIGLSMLGWGMENYTVVKYALLLFPVVYGFGFLSNVKKPSIKAKKRTRKLERDLPYALRHILIEVEAGMSLYRSLVAVTENYGQASKEFNKIVNDINAGKSEKQALEEAVIRNPSKQFRRALWQIINAQQSGADISNTLNSLVENITEKQILAVEEYGKELNPYTLMYMLVAIIMPSLGVTFIMILSTFTGMTLSDKIFYLILIGLVLFQLIFVNLIKSKRPMVRA